MVVAVAVGLTLLVRGWGDSELTLPDPPVGSAVLPDLQPSPPIDLRTKLVKDKWFIAFSSILVNVGEGAFVLRATREDNRPWRVFQEIPYSESGARSIRIPARMVYAGDGHHHWHVARVATARLVRIDDSGKPTADESGRIDTKIGFCFFDYTHDLERGPENAVYHRRGCGHEDDDFIRMGLSDGWTDTYKFVLRGQRIPITGLPDGKYRLWADADEAELFREVTRDNNRTWADFDLSTRADGIRLAVLDAVGPKPK